MLAVSRAVIGEPVSIGFETRLNTGMLQNNEQWLQ